MDVPSKKFVCAPFDNIFKLTALPLEKTATLGHVSSRPPGRCIHCPITTDSLLCGIVHVVNHNLVDVIMLPARIVIIHSPLRISQIVVQLEIFLSMTQLLVEILSAMIGSNEDGLCGVIHQVICDVLVHLTNAQAPSLMLDFIHDSFLSLTYSYMYILPSSLSSSSSSTSSGIPPPPHQRWSMSSSFLSWWHCVGCCFALFLSLMRKTAMARTITFLPFSLLSRMSSAGIQNSRPNLPLTPRGGYDNHHNRLDSVW